MVKYRLLRDRVANELAGVELVEAPLATVDELALAHALALLQALAV